MRDVQSFHADDEHVQPVSGTFNWSLPIHRPSANCSRCETNYHQPIRIYEAIPTRWRFPVISMILRYASELYRVGLVGQAFYDSTSYDQDLDQQHPLAIYKFELLEWEISRRDSSANPMSMHCSLGCIGIFPTPVWERLYPSNTMQNEQERSALYKYSRQLVHHQPPERLTLEPAITRGLTRSSRGEVSRHLIRLWFDEPAEKPDLTISGSSNTFLPILGFRILHHDGHIPVRSEVNSLTPQADWSSTSLGEVKTKTPAGW